ncbi:MAG: hypothetical protein JO171_08275 [Paludibacterium sp.]|uniref:hypothetical protein n=1 Tax=Paludibacterium sp. TaxID=1917523 RepID=UPI0025D0BFB6|nr:hypothetical protein [Paludibacterium sp.]MBV8047133.1 hypothetical protein [Paludibacterium sp.]MBV8648736.1 hypothetical protein [Paludibacterium sp.]
MTTRTLALAFILNRYNEDILQQGGTLEDEESFLLPPSKFYQVEAEIDAKDRGISLLHPLNALKIILNLDQGSGSHGLTPSP